MKLCLILPLVYLVLVPSSGQRAHKGTLDSILDKLKDGNTLPDALKSVKILESYSKVYKSLASFSPLFTGIWQKLGQLNPKYKLDLDVLGGHIPSLMDLYNLVKHRNIHVAFTSVLASDQNFQELTALMNKTDFQDSKEDIERTIFLLTGHKIDVGSAMVLDSSTHKWNVAKTRDSKSRNLVEIILFLHDIWNPFLNIFDYSTETSFNLPGFLEAYLRINYTRLNEISALPISGEKYTVKGNAGIDTDVRQILQLHKTVETNFNNQKYFDALAIQAESDAKLFEMCNRALEQALSDNSAIVG